MAFTFQTQSNYNEVASAHERVQPGWYEAVVLAAVEKYSRAGSPMIELSLGVDVGRPKPFELKSWLVLTTSAAWKIEQFLAATGKQFRKGEQLSIDARTCEGKRLCVTLCNRATDKGGLWPEIQDFRRREDCPHLGAMNTEELTQWGLNPDGTRKTLTQVVREELNAPPAASPNSPNPSPMPYEEDDDIPF